MNPTPALDEFCIRNIVRFVPLDDRAPLARVSSAWRAAVIAESMRDWPAGPLVAQGNIVRLLVRAHETPPDAPLLVGIEEIGRAAAAGHRHTVRLAMRLGAAHLEAVAAGAIWGHHTALALEALRRFPRAECGCFTTASGMEGINGCTCGQPAEEQAPIRQWAATPPFCEESRDIMDEEPFRARFTAATAWIAGEAERSQFRSDTLYIERFFPLARSISRIWYTAGPKALADFLATSQEVMRHLSAYENHTLSAVRCLCDPDLYAFVLRELNIADPCCLNAYVLGSLIYECGEGFMSIPPWAIIRAFPRAAFAQDHNAERLGDIVAYGAYGMEDLDKILGPELAERVRISARDFGRREYPGLHRYAIGMPD